MLNKFILGTVQFGLDYGINNPGGKPTQENVSGILDFAFSSGIRELDTADAYGNSNEVLKEYFLSHPEKFEVMSKFIANSSQAFGNSFESSLQRLGVSRLKGYYFHRFSDFLEFDQFEVVHELKKSGRLELLAVSLYTEDELAKAVASPEVDVIQLPFNIFDCSKRKVELMKKAKEAGKLIYIRSVFLQGLFFMNPEKLPEKLKPFTTALVELNKLSLESGKGIQEICLNYALSKQFIDKVIIGVDSIQQLHENVSLSSGEFPDNFVKRLESITITAPELLNPSNWK